MADTGGGHRSVALSLAEACRDRADAGLLDLLDDYAPFPWNRMAVAYDPWTEYVPWLWQAAYHFGASRRHVAWLERLSYASARPRVIDPLLAQAGDLVIAVHPLQTTIPLRILREAGCTIPFVTVVTDPVSPPAVWFCSDVDLCIVATEQARVAALAAGMPAERVRVIGHPVRRAFTNPQQTKSAARLALDLPEERPLVLIAGGGAGLGRLLALVGAVTQRLAGDGVAAQVTVLAGRNEGLRRRLASEAWPVPVHVLGFTPEPEHWLAAADLLLTKAGPSTLAEAACMGVPMILTGYVPGQEAGNVEWVVQSGAGAYAPMPEQAAALAATWLSSDPELLRSMAARARALARPHAAEEIMDAALALVGERVAV
jgi:1,2-diacylglycerol 3-beta-galactosyltransferase